MNRGSERFMQALICQYACFNEAPIHESGKCECIWSNEDASGLLQ